MLDWTPETYGNDWADGYDHRFAHLTDTEPAVRALADLAAGGPVLELGVGTGRLALPLVEHGLRVDAVEASDKMIARLRAKPMGQRVAIVAKNFSDFDIAERYSLIFMSRNTIFDLPGQKAQVSCLVSAARHLRPEGLLAVEASVPDLVRFNEGRFLKVAKATDSELVLDTIAHYPAAQQTHRRRVAITEDGIEFNSVRNRYIWPSELDLMARIAGLELKVRWNGWERQGFDDTGSAHVSVYESVRTP